MIKLFRILLVISAFFLATSAQAAVTFNFTYADTTTGFYDPAYGAQRRSALEYVANTMIGSQLNYTATVDIAVELSTLDASTGILGSCGTLCAMTNNSIQPGYVYQHITTGIDPDASQPDGGLRVNFGYDWYIGTAAPGATQMDFTSVMLHELTHALGFVSFMGSNGLGDAPGYPNLYSTFDTFLINGSGTEMINETTFTFQGNVSDLTSAVYFDGTNANAANGGNAVLLYTPATWSDGSSISHVNDSADLMYYSSNDGEMNRSWSAIDIAILKDLGYSFVPEPATLAILTFGGAMLLIRRKRLKRA